MIRHAALAAALTGFAGGCATALDDARIAWADGEGEFEEAERLYKQAMKNPKVDELAKEELLEIYLDEGAAMVKKGKYKKAEEMFRGALEIDPDEEDATAGLARCLRQMYKFDEALAVARKGVESGKCRRCRRLVAVLLIRRGDALMEQGKWAEAETDYIEAEKIIPDAGVALAIVRARYSRKDLDAAAKGLREAVTLVGAADVVARTTYLELRRDVVLLALQEGQADLADELLDLVPSGVGGEEQLGIAMEVALEFNKYGKPDVALGRLMALVGLAGEGKIQITPERLEELRDKIATLRASRASLRLADGDIDGAEEDLNEAVSLRPKDPAFKLQRVLIVAGRGKMAKARSDLAKIKAKARGRKEVQAILYALDVDRLLSEGNVAGAKAELVKAKAAAKDLPEVHIAAAQVLAASEPGGLAKAQAAELKKSGLVKYPGGRITRAGEALSELDWSHQQIKGLGTTYPYRAPGTDKRLADLERKLKEFFVFSVKFHGNPTAILVLKNKGSEALKVEVKGGNVADTKEVPAEGKAEITVPKPGFVQLKYRGTTAALLTEPYTQLEVGL